MIQTPILKLLLLEWHVQGFLLQISWHLVADSCKVWLVSYLASYVHKAYSNYVFETLSLLSNAAESG